MNTDTKEDSLTLGILEEIEKNQGVTQRHLARQLGVALGLANSYLKRCARKGFIKIQQAPANRYLYYLTPKGFSEKSRLTAEYLSTSFEFYGRSSDSLRDIFSECERAGLRHVLLCGISELAEIGTLRAQDYKVTITGFYDPGYQDSQFLKYPVYRNFADVPTIDACILTSLLNSRGMYGDVQNQAGSIKVLVPTILGIGPGTQA